MKRTYVRSDVKALISCMSFLDCLTGVNQLIMNPSEKSFSKIYKREEIML